jgi:hypothetical protein
MRPLPRGRLKLDRYARRVGYWIPAADGTTMRVIGTVQKNPGWLPGETGDVNPAGEFAQVLQLLDGYLLSTTCARCGKSYGSGT